MRTARWIEKMRPSYYHAIIRLKLLPAAEFVFLDLLAVFEPHPDLSGLAGNLRFGSLYSGS